MKLPEPKPYHAHVRDILIEHLGRYAAEHPELDEWRGCAGDLVRQIHDRPDLTLVAQRYRLHYDAVRILRQLEAENFCCAEYNTKRPVIWCIPLEQLKGQTTSAPVNKANTNA